jgi:hypothetical protein
VAKLPTESHGDEEPIIHSFQALSVEADGTASRQQSVAITSDDQHLLIAFLLDHLIRPRQQRRRDRQVEGPGGLEVDD